MKTSLALLAGAVLLAEPVTAQDPDEPRPDSAIHVLIDTDVGHIEVALDSAAAPITVANFLRYVNAGLYDGGTFYRTVRPDNQPNDNVKIEVIQGGMNRSRQDEGFPPIPLEGTAETGIRHLDGTISMARSGPDTGRAEFFICVGDQPELDAGGSRNPDGFGFAAFGRVIHGMEVVREIQRREANANQRLVDPVLIREMRRIR